MFRNFDIPTIRITADKPPNSRLHLVTLCGTPTFCLIDIDTAHTDRPCAYIQFLFKQLGDSSCRKCMCGCASVSTYLSNRDNYCYQLHITTLLVNIKLVISLQEDTQCDQILQHPVQNGTGQVRSKLSRTKKIHLPQKIRRINYLPACTQKIKYYCRPSCTAYCHQVLMLQHCQL